MSYSIAQGTLFKILWQTIMEKNMKKNIHASGKEPANAGDKDMTPGLERSPGEGNGNPL